MKTSNRSNKQEEVIARPKRGAAAENGFINRSEYRKSLKKAVHRGSNRRDSIFLMGRQSYIPSYAPKRKKLKGWQKRAQKQYQ